MKIVARPRKGERVDRCKTWLLVWELPHAKGERVPPVTETFHGNKTDAQERWRDRQAEIDAKRFIAPTKETVAAYLQRWLKSAAPDLEPTTMESYARTVRIHIEPAIGTVALSDLTAAAIQAMVDEMRTRLGPRGKPLAARTVAYARTVLRVALQEAVRLGTLPANPVDRVKAPKQAARRVEAFTVQQAGIILDRADGARVRHLLEFAWLTGLRRGELVAVRWRDVDLQAGIATVRRSRVVLKGGSLEKEPKTEAGLRAVALPARAVEVLRRQRALQAQEKLAAGPAYEDDGLIFATVLGRPLGPTNVSRDFRHLRDLAACPECRRLTSPTETGGQDYHCRRCDRIWHGGDVPQHPFHALRHTAVSVQLAAGVPLEVVSKRIGHRKLSTTADIYGHLLPEANRGAAAAVDAFLSRAAETAGSTEGADVTGNVTGTRRNGTDATRTTGQAPEGSR